MVIWQFQCGNRGMVSIVRGSKVIEYGRRGQEVVQSDGGRRSF